MEATLTSWIERKPGNPDKHFAVSGFCTEDFTRDLEAVGIPVYEEATHATRAVAALAGFARSFRERCPRPAVPASASLPTGPVNELAALNIAAAAGVPTVPARTAQPDAAIHGCFLAARVTGGVETILGVQRDPVFGPIVMFWLGGFFVEALKAVTFRAAPFDEAEARAMIESLAAWPLLTDLRGHPRAALSRFAAARPRPFRWPGLRPTIRYPEAVQGSY